MIVRLQNVRLAFASLFEPKEQLNGDKKFEGNFILPPGVKYGLVKEGDEWVKRKIHDILVAVAKEKGWKNAESIVDGLESGRTCFRDGDKNTNNDGDVYSGYEGSHYVVAKSKNRPDVVDRLRQRVNEGDNLIYNGCYVNASVDIYVVDQKEKGGKGVFADLRAVQFVKDGEAFSGRTAVDTESEFDDLGDSEDDDLA